MRPSVLLKDNVLYWTIRVYDPSDGVTLINADSVPTVAIRKNGAAVGDSVTVTKRASTTGIYDCSYNPASEIDGDEFVVEESAVISSTTYSWNWSFTVRGSSTVTVSAAAAALDAVDESGRITFYRGDRLSFTRTLGSLVGRTGEKLFFTLKRKKDADLTDAKAIIQATEASGLVWLNGAEGYTLDIKTF